MINHLNKNDFSLETVQQRQSELKAFEEKASKEEADLSEIKIPFDNSKFNCFKVEPSLGNNNSLTNVVLLEFDFKNSNINKEKLKHFIEINNEYVDKEIMFVLTVLSI
jgi:hypothetical protein